jgi:uncharacterized protein
MQKIRILSLSGGGIRGYLSARVIADLETSRPFLNSVDLFAGTSTGAIIAVYLASGLMKSPDELVKFYHDEGPKIFRRSIKQSALSIFGLYTSRYDVEYLGKVLIKMFGDMRLGDLKKMVLVPAVDVGDEDGRRPYQAKFFDNFKGNSTDLDIRVVDVILASTAAPSYFDSHTIEHANFGKRQYVDGGFVCNHPAVSAICCAQDDMGLGADLKDICCIHIASGYFPRSARGWKKRGIISWAKKAFELAMEQYTTVCYQADKLIDDRFRCIGTTFNEAIELDDSDGIRKIDNHYPNLRGQLMLTKQYLNMQWEGNRTQRTGV